MIASAAHLAAHLAVQLTSKGLLQFNLELDAPRLSNGQPDALADRLSAAFARGAGHGLLHLGVFVAGLRFPASQATTLREGH